MGCIYDGKRYKIFYDKEIMKANIISRHNMNKNKGKNTIIYGHNIIYDFLGLYKKELLNNEFKIIRWNPLIAKSKSGITYCDTRALMGGSLEECGRRIGIPKLDLPKCLELGRDEKEILERYIERDCLITYEIVRYIQKGLEELDYKPRYLITTPQLAKNCFMKWATKYDKNYEITAVKNHKRGIIGTKYDDFCRKAYRGGRNEAFRIGCFDNCTMVDQIRQYPYAASVMDFPVLKKEFRCRRPLEIMSMRDLFDNYVGFCKAEVIAKDNHYGILPIRYNGKNIYPTNNQMSGTWTIEELSVAEKNGYKIIDIEDSVFYKKSENNPLKRYFWRLFKIEKERPDMKIITKLMMNGLIGKLGAKIVDSDEIIDFRDKSNKMKSEGFGIKAAIGSKFVYYRENSKFIPEYGNVALSALVTAKARLIANSYIRKIDKEDLIYMDTDGFIFRGNHKNKFIFGGEMGEFRLLGENQRCEVLGRKDYKYGNEVKLAGYSKKDLNEGTFEAVKRGEAKHTKMVGFMEALRNDNIELAGTFEEELYKINDEIEKEIPFILEEE